MIVRDFFETRIDGIRLYKTYSDKGYYIKQQPTGIIYQEAIDVEDAPYEYEETDMLIEPIPADLLHED